MSRPPGKGDWLFIATIAVAFLLLMWVLFGPVAWKALGGS